METNSWLRSWWWTGAFCVCMIAIYGHKMKTQGSALREANIRLAEIERKTLAALKEKEDLALTLASQSDPAWIELVLLRQMGVVPEGFLKVHFKNLTQ